MGGPLVNPLNGMGTEERRRTLLRELDLYGGSPTRVARSFGVTIARVQQHIDSAGLRGAARRARDRWERMFSLGGNDEG